jgi:HSP20 family protein
MARWFSSDPLWTQWQGSQGPSVWSQLQNLQQEMNRLFNRWGGDGNREMTMAGSYPLLNVWEDGDAIVIEGELPGVHQNDLELYVTDGNQFTLKGERKSVRPEKGVWHRQERGTGKFVRVLTLPFEVDRDKVEAHLENGVLTVKLAKHASAKPRKITVKAE